VLTIQPGVTGSVVVRSCSGLSHTEISRNRDRPREKHDMRYVSSVLILLTLLPVAQAQDNEAEKLFRAMEKKITAADAIQVTVAIELRAIKGSGNESKLKEWRRLLKVRKASGFLILTKDNKAQMKIRGANVGLNMEMVSNGKQLRLGNEEGILDPAKPRPTPKYLHALLTTLVSRTGVTAGGVTIRFAPGPQFEPVFLTLEDGEKLDFDPEKLGWGVSDIKAGAADKVGGRDAKVISYRFEKGDGGRDTLWLDNKTLLPLKRVYTLGRDMHITEIYTEFNLDPQIDAKAFELIPTPNEPEKLFRAMVGKIKAAQAVEVTFDSEAKWKEQAKDKEAKSKGSLLFTKDNKARLKMSGNETGKEVTIEAISDGKRWKMAESPATIAKAEEEPTRTDLHTLLSTELSEFSSGSINYLFNGPAGPKRRLVDFNAGAEEKVGGRDAKVVTYSVVVWDKSSQVTVWIDTETLLPLKRLIVSEAGRGTEIYNFILNPKVEAGAFALPK